MTPDARREEFLENVRQALGRRPGPPEPGEHPTAFFRDGPSVEKRARAVIDEAKANAEELMSRLEQSASEIGWKVFRAASAEEARDYIAKLARDLEARVIVRSAHPAVERLDLDGALETAGAAVHVMAADEHQDRQTLRQRAISADLGVTGVDFSIAETGSCAMVSGKGASRLPSLLPPVHVAVVEKGQVLPGLDELFALRRAAAVRGEAQGYMNIVSGPSRSADIEHTLVTGVHGPGEVHMVLLG